MERLLGVFLSIFCWASALSVFAAEKFDILPDLPETLSYTVPTAQASAVSNTNANNIVDVQNVGQEPNFLSIIFSLLIVIVLIYITGIVYAKLNKFGMSALKTDRAELNSLRVSVLSTTSLGNNKTLHVVELDGKRMLLGASSSSIMLLKDLGESSATSIEEGEYSRIEIPNITIPKIEIPKIEIPSFKFSSHSTRTHNKGFDPKYEAEKDLASDDKFVISEIYEEDNSENIIDRLFDKPETEQETVQTKENEHKVDPDEYALYKKYIS